MWFKFNKILINVRCVKMCEIKINFIYRNEEVIVLYIIFLYLRCLIFDLLNWCYFFLLFIVYKKRNSVYFNICIVIKVYYKYKWDKLI